MQKTNKSAGDLMPRIAIVGGGNSEYYTLLSKVGAIVSKKDDDIDLMLFTGGEDVTPAFYGGVHEDVSSINTYRDDFEKGVFEDCVRRHIKMVGICRGIQFLNAMAGGKMYQHISGHSGVSHTIQMLATGEIYKVICTHHQMIIPPLSAHVISKSLPELSQIFIGPDCTEQERPSMEVEAAIFPNINAFGVQFHPEFMVAPEESANLFVRLTTMFLNGGLNKLIQTYGRKTNEQRRQEASA